jgi:hypothetical protein
MVLNTFRKTCHYLSLTPIRGFRKTCHYLSLTPKTVTGLEANLSLMKTLIRGLSVTGSDRFPPLLPTGVTSSDRNLPLRLTRGRGEVMGTLSLPVTDRHRSHFPENLSLPVTDDRRAS